MKKLVMALVVLTIFIPINSYANDDFDTVIQQELDKIDLSSFDKLLEKQNEEKLFEGKDAKTLILEFASGKSNIDFDGVLKFVISKTTKALSKNLYYITVVLAIVVASTVIANMTTDSIGGINEIAQYVCFILVISFLLKVVFDYVAMTIDIINTLKDANRIIFAPLLTLMTALGGVSSAGIFKPAMAMLCSGMVEFVGNGILPIAIMGSVTTMFSGISRYLHIKKLSEFCFSCAKWLLGIGFTVYVGILSIQGMMASTFDGVYMRTAKYAVDSIVPIVGGMMSDTVDTLIGCSLIIKNSVGFTGLLIMVSIIISPVINMFVGIFAYKLLAAMLESITDSKIVDSVSGVADTLTVLFAIVLVVSSMSFITITLAINAGNTNMMLR